MLVLKHYCMRVSAHRKYVSNYECSDYPALRFCRISRRSLCTWEPLSTTSWPLRRPIRTRTGMPCTLAIQNSQLSRQVTHARHVVLVARCVRARAWRYFVTAPSHLTSLVSGLRNRAAVLWVGCWNGVFDPRVSVGRHWR